MNRINLILMLIVLVTINSFAQKNNCNCDITLKELVGKVERNYAGYADKVNSNNQKEYEDKKKKLLQFAKKSKSDTSCQKLLQEYVNFFWDNHLVLHFNVSTGENKQQQSKSIKNEEWYLPKVVTIDSATIAVTLPNFLPKYAKAIRDTIAKYREQIIKTENLILDVSRNSGGAIFAFEPLLEFIYTNSITYYGKKVWSTEENVEVLTQWVEDNKGILPEDEYNNMINHINRLKSGINSWIIQDDKIVDEYLVLKYPKRVAILIDKNCGSSGELFVLMAMQSNKVITFGQNTNGTVDYGNSIKHKLSCKQYSVSIPIVRNNWIDEYGPIDKEGIKPEIIIPGENTNWIDFVINYWKEN